MPVATAPDAANLHWAEYGVGRPLVLLGAQALGEAAWRPLLPTLAQHHRVIVPSYRGVGESSAVFPAAWTTRTIPDDVLCVLDAAGVSAAHVWGFSFGGRIAQWLAADHPGRVAGLVLTATTAGDRTGVPRNPEITSRMLHPQRRALADLFFTPPFLAANRELGATVTRTIREPATLRAHYQASQNHDAAEALGQIKAPTLITHGGADEICPPSNGQLLATRIPGARLRFTPQGRHAAHLEFPAVATAVLRFLAEVDGGARRQGQP